MKTLKHKNSATFLKIGVLSLQGGVVEHVQALMAAAVDLGLRIEIIEVRNKQDLAELDGLIVPGGESTVLHKLLEREDMFAAMKKIPAIMGTCAGAILLAKKVLHRTADQRTFELMDITVDRNAYGRQAASFETSLATMLGECQAVFIRAPRFVRIESGVAALASHNAEIVAAEQRSKGQYYLALAFHPELTTIVWHRYFLAQMKRA